MRPPPGDGHCLRWHLPEGRTLWRDALESHLAGKISDSEAAQAIADNYSKLIDVYNEAASKKHEGTLPAP